MLAGLIAPTSGRGVGSGRAADATDDRPGARPGGLPHRGAGPLGSAQRPHEPADLRAAPPARTIRTGSSSARSSGSGLSDRARQPGRGAVEGPQAARRHRPHAAPRSARRAARRADVGARSAERARWCAISCSSCAARGHAVILSDAQPGRGRAAGRSRRRTAWPFLAIASPTDLRRRIFGARVRVRVHGDARRFVHDSRQGRREGRQRGWQ